MRILLVILCLSLQPLCGEMIWEESRDGGIHAEMHLSSQEIRSDENVKLSLHLSYPEGYSLDAHHLRQQLLGSSEETGERRLAVLSEKKLTHTLKDGQWTHIVEFELEPLLTGYYPSDITSIVLRGKEGETVELNPPIVQITVELTEKEDPAEGNIANLLPITDKPLISLDPAFKEERLYDEEQQKKEARRNEDLFADRSFPWQLVLAALAGLLLLYLGKRVLPWMRKKTKPELDLLDPKERALIALKELRNRHLPEQKLFDTFYTRLTGVVRHFIEDQYGVQAPEQTTEEFLGYAKSHSDFLPEDREALAGFLLYADLVKFAAMSPSIADCDQAFDSAESFVKRSPKAQ